LEEDVPLPPPSDPAANTQSTQNTPDQSTASQPDETASSPDVEQEPQSEDIGVQSAAKRDSVLIAELKKEIEDIKKLTPDDSLPKEQVQQKDAKQAQKVLTDNTRNSYEDRKFIYDNYHAILALKKVYPYVQKTKEIVNRMNAQLAKITDKGEKRRLIKQTEKELFGQFEKDIRNMSTSQGKLLLKLIARETDQTAYGLIKTYKGTIPATFWYGIGVLFHENLKMKYDSLGEDAQLEKIVQKYKLGKL
ncbi:MAG: DUF4294 domain-containing protein, partial [Bacteroidota bacterium]|nr:DUF4294 domain-containing protein [Bacteroidota bacterium]